MYAGISAFLTDREKKKLFNTYTHDFLIRRQNQLSNQERRIKNRKEEKIKFDIEQEFLDLEYKCGKDFYLDKKKGKEFLFQMQTAGVFMLQKILIN